MNSGIVAIFYATCSVAAVWLGLLWLVARLRVRPCSRLASVLFGVATLLVLIAPFGGLSLWSWVFSLYPNPSLLVIGMVGAALWEKLFGFPILRTEDWRAVWAFGAIVGSVLYLHTLCLGKLDLYYWGWDRERATWCMAAVAMAFLAWGNRLGVLLVVALAAFCVEALESDNAWDYLIDPFFWLIGLGFFAARFSGYYFEWIRRRASRTRILGPQA